MGQLRGNYIWRGLNALRGKQRFWGLDKRFQASGVGLDSIPSIKGEGRGRTQGPSTLFGPRLTALGMTDFSKLEFPYGGIMSKQVLRFAQDEQLRRVLRYAQG